MGSNHLRHNVAWLRVRHALVEADDVLLEQVGGQRTVGVLNRLKNAAVLAAGSPSRTTGQSLSAVRVLWISARMDSRMATVRSATSRLPPDSAMATESGVQLVETLEGDARLFHSIQQRFQIVQRLCRSVPGGTNRAESFEHDPGFHHVTQREGRDGEMDLEQPGQGT